MNGRAYMAFRRRLFFQCCQAEPAAESHAERGLRDDGELRADRGGVDVRNDEVPGVGVATGPDIAIGPEAHPVEVLRGIPHGGRPVGAAD